MISRTDNKVKYNGDGVTVTFAFAFAIYNDSDLVVIKTNNTTLAETVLTLNIDYSIVYPETGIGGNVVLDAGTVCPYGNTLTILRSVDYLQSIDFVNGESVSAETIELGLDKQTLLNQDQQEILTRALLVKRSSALTGMELPNAVPNRPIGWDASGTALVNLQRVEATSTIFDHIGNYTSLAQAVLEIGPAKKTLVIDEAIVISTGLTVTTPNTLTLMIIQGGTINGVGSGEVLEINGHLEAGRYQIFGDLLTVSGSSKTVYPEWWGAVPNGTADCLVAFDSAASFLTGGGEISIGVGSYALSDSFELPDAEKLKGVNTASSIIIAKAGSTITGGLITNKTKSPIGQEFFFIEDLYLSGNVGNATVDALIYVENIFVNSYIKNVLARDVSGHCLHISRTAFGFGPLYIDNSWFCVAQNHLVYIEGGTGITFNSCSFENVAANKDCLHITRDITRAIGQVLLVHPHFEYSNIGVRAIYSDGGIINAIMPEFLGNGAADQYNMYIDNVVSEGNSVSYLITQAQQAPSGGRKGIYIKDIDTEYTALFTDMITDMTPIFTKGYGMISFGEESQLPAFADGDTTPSVKGRSFFRTQNTTPTEITEFTDISPEQIVTVFVYDEFTTFKQNGLMQTAGDSFVASKNSIITFVCNNTTAIEMSRSLNHKLTRTIGDDGTTPNIYGAPRILENNSIATDWTRFLRSNEGLLYVLFNTANTTLKHGTYIVLKGSIDYNPVRYTSMLFYISEPDGVAFEVSRTSP